MLIFISMTTLYNYYDPAPYRGCQAMPDLQQLQKNLTAFTIIQDTKKKKQVKPFLQAQKNNKKIEAKTPPKEVQI